MPKYLRSAEKIKLNSYNDLFGETVEAESIGEKLIEVSLSELHDFKGHPFIVRDDEEMERLVESIREYGVLHPGIARPMKKGKGYELIAGHRRKRASEIAGKEKMPVFVKDYDNDEATIIMVDSNLQREKLLLSEKAKAYRMKYEALKHQGKSGGCTLDSMGDETGESGKQVQRIIRVAFLEDGLAAFVDNGRIKLNAAVELSYLDSDDQKMLSQVLENEKAAVTVKKAEELKKRSQAACLSEKDIKDVLCVASASKQVKGRRLTMDFSKFGDSIENMSDKDVEELIFRLLDDWARKM